MDMDIAYWQQEDKKLLDRVMSSMGFGPSSLAKRLREMAGDRWETGSCLRAIQRAKRGETNMSPTLRMVLLGLDRDWRRAEQAAEKVEWEKRTGGILHTVAHGFGISLIPQTKNRWKVQIEHLESGYSPSWIEWLDNLETAKIRAFVQLDDTLLDLSWPGNPNIKSE
ncbi:hypothetical protein [Komagataeibacter sp. FXV3]|uniref:hypothetical protein n=1 Tax=Komagataeibacter sp. FXV3 TaxID=2608998 RepID=UPI00187B46C4|nr:hypothetical protein [Komagataeibacter sp. FXV3]MBE7729048.1 hypothetical protein [Komagataeibacter sp. FXV3]